MPQTTLSDLQKALSFLKKEGFAVYFSLTDSDFAALGAELTPFFTENRGESGFWIPVFYEEKERLRVGTEKKKDAPLLLLLRPLLERLLEEAHEEAQDQNERDLYRKSLNFIKEHYMKGITVADIAREVGYSSSYFGYIFKKKHGIPVNQYVRELQLAKAKDLLQNTSFSVSAVAEYVGYEDANYFSSLFKKQFGLSPKQYRNNQKRKSAD